MAGKPANVYSQEELDEVYRLFCEINNLEYNTYRHVHYSRNGRKIKVNGEIIADRVCSKWEIRQYFGHGYEECPIGNTSKLAAPEGMRDSRKVEHMDEIIGILAINEAYRKFLAKRGIRDARWKSRYQYWKEAKAASVDANKGNATGVGRAIKDGQGVG